MPGSRKTTAPKAVSHEGERQLEGSFTALVASELRKDKVKKCFPGVQRLLKSLDAIPREGDRKKRAQRKMIEGLGKKGVTDQALELKKLAALVALPEVPPEQEENLVAIGAQFFVRLSSQEASSTSKNRAAIAALVMNEVFLFLDTLKERTPEERDRLKTYKERLAQIIVALIAVDFAMNPGMHNKSNRLDMHVLMFLQGKHHEEFVSLMVCFFSKKDKSGCLKHEEYINTFLDELCQVYRTARDRLTPS